MSTRTSLVKRVSNYELFFDLAFVLALRELNGSFHMEHISGQNILLFVMANIVLMNIWFNEVLYYQKYGDSRRADIYTVIALMFSVGHLAMNFNLDTYELGAGSPVVVQFNSLLFLAYGIITLQYFIKGRVLGFNRDMKLSMLSLLLYMLLLFPFIVGIGGWSIWMSVVYILPVLIPILFAKLFYSGEEDLPTNFPHAVERGQLITILSFGESVIAIIGSYPIGEMLVNGVFLFTAMAFMFINYMAQTFTAIDHHSKKLVVPLFYCHLLVVLGINFFTVSVEFLANHHHAELGQILLMIAVALFYLGTYFLTIYNYVYYQFKAKNIIHLSIGLLVTLLALWLVGPSPLWLGLVLSLSSYLVGLYIMRFRMKARQEHGLPQPDRRLNLRDFS